MTPEGAGEPPDRAPRTSAPLQHLEAAGRPLRGALKSLRRIRFLLEFPMPDTAMRRRLWEQSQPDKALHAPGGRHADPAGAGTSSSAGSSP